MEPNNTNHECRCNECKAMRERIYREACEELRRENNYLREEILEQLKRKPFKVTLREFFGFGPKK